MSPIRFHPALPILLVRDLQASIDHDVGVLGFSLDWHEPGIICSLSRDRCALMLEQGEVCTPATQKLLSGSHARTSAVWVSRSGREPGMRRIGEASRPRTVWVMQESRSDNDGH